MKRHLTLAFLSANIYVLFVLFDPQYGFIMPSIFAISVMNMLSPNRKHCKHLRSAY